MNLNRILFLATALISVLLSTNLWSQIDHADGLISGNLDTLGSGENFPIFNLPVKVLAQPVRDTIYPNESLRFRITIHNNMDKKPFRFYKLKTLYNQLYFQILDDQGRPVDKTIMFERFLLQEDWQNQDYLDNGSNIPSRSEPEASKRAMEIRPGENFSFLISLENFYNITHSGRYFVKGFFYPLGRVSTDDYGSLDAERATIAENYKLALEEFAFEVRPHPFYQNNFENDSTLLVKNDSKDFQSKAQSESVNFFQYPTEVVKQHLVAIQKKRWDSYFNTLYLEKFLVNTYPTTDYYERYQSAYPDEKLIIIDGFKNFLIRSIDYDIKEYTFLKTIIVDGRAEVEVILSTAEPFQNLINTRDSETGLMKNQWVQEDEKWLNRKLKITYYLEQIETLVPPKLSDGRGYRGTGVAGLANIAENPSGSFDLHTTHLVWKISSQDVKIVNDQPSTAVLTGVEPEPEFFKEIIHFSLNNGEVNPKYYGFLSELASFIKRNKGVTIDVKGYTDDLGDSEYNYKLSFKRAESVAKYLERKGVHKDRITLISLGESQPISTLTDEKSRRLNRRVEIVIKENL